MYIFVYCVACHKMKTQRNLRNELVFIFYYCVRIYHKLKALPSCLIDSVDQKSQQGIIGFYAQGLMRLTSRWWLVL